jgi:hypothetical protein
MTATASQGFHMFHAHTDSLWLQRERNVENSIMKHSRSELALHEAYQIATGSDERISRTFSNPKAVM